MLYAALFCRNEMPSTSHNTLINLLQYKTHETTNIYYSRFIVHSALRLYYIHDALGALFDAKSTILIL